MKDEAEIIQAVLDVERRWVAAHRDLDLDTIKHILADDYRQIRDDGTVISRDELIQSYSSGTRYWEIAESDDYEIRLSGNVALLIGRWRGRGEYGGQAFDYTARFLAVYRLDEGKWKLVSDVSVPLED